MVTHNFRVISVYSLVGKTCMPPTSCYWLSKSWRQLSTRTNCRDHSLTFAMAAVKDLSRAIRPPACVLGMVELKREAFNTVASAPSFEVDVKDVAAVLNHVRKYLLKLPNFRAVQESTDNNRKRFHLDPAKVCTIEDMDPAARGVLSEARVTVLGERRVSLSYDNWPAEDVLRAVIGQPDASGYSIIGHVLHLNLREHLQPYKKLIGQVYLDKVKNVRCVVSKASTIESTFRNFRMELLAGEQDTKVHVRQNGARFEFDFADVYWNPRLSTEHARIIALLRKDDVLYDIFAGVGPFAIPAALKGCTVIANDLNPHSFTWLNHNVSLNKVLDRVSTHNLDGRQFISEIVGASLPAHLAADRRVHVCMNLPALATEFLNAFVGLLRGTNDSDPKVESWRIRVHCYCFVKGEEGVTGAKQKLEEGLGRPTERDVQVSFVRNVAPNKDMMRASFDLSWDILHGVGCPPAKRCKVDDKEQDAAVEVASVE